MEFLTPGEKIKKLRKQFNMIQQDFEEEFMTRSYFGMIEAGKRNINEKIATSIAEKFNKKAKSLGVDLEVSPEYLMMSPQEEARHYCKDKLSQDLKEEEIYDVLSIAKEYDLPEIEMEAYKKVGIIYHSNYRYLDAFIAFSNALDIAKNIDEKQIQAYLYNKLGACKYPTMEYIEALVYFEKANSYATIYVDKSIEIMSLFNIALCYRKLGKFDNAIKYADICLSIIDGKSDMEKYIHANMIKFNSYGDMGEYDKALEIGHMLLDWIEDKESISTAFLYNNIANMYLEKGVINKSMEFFNKSQEIRKEKEPSKLSHTIIDKSRIYIKQGMNMEAAMLLELGIELTMKYNDQDYLLRAYYYLIDVYYALDDFENVEQTYFKIINILKPKGNSELIRIYLEMSKLYIKKGDLEEAEKYINLSQRSIVKRY
ncbi:helix-turn-helix domain-containing protein [Clostridium thermarum]|uniref:helix-turn-helix domain-containing protein n=1 Tax=Clostridium thermarum TaxID=1716543 RepID=UPI0013D3D15A|nr:helix-turn-helix transcriptional regulator [Clostridium thermarum]